MGAITIRLAISHFPILMGWKSSGWGTAGAAFEGFLLAVAMAWSPEWWRNAQGRFQRIS